MVNINPNEPREENYIHDPNDPMDEDFPSAWLGCITIITFLLLIALILYLIITYGG